MSKNYLSYPAEETSSGLRTVFLYAAAEDVSKLQALAEKIAHPKSGTKCRVKWLTPDTPVDETDLKNELTLSQVLIVYVTKSLLAHMREQLPLPIQFMRDNHKPYFPIADVAENLEIYCKLDRPIHGLMESDEDFDNKLKEQLSKYVLDEETLAEIREKGIINQIFLSYRKDDVIAAQNLMREIHNFKGFDAISIWYDRFLAAGNLFDKEILDALDQSSAFTMVISPKITAKREDGSNNYVVEHEYPRAHEKNKPIVPIHLPNYTCKHDDLKSVFKDIPELLAIEQTEPYLRSIFPDLPSVDTYSSERLYLLGRAYLSGFYFEQDSKKAVSLLKKAAGYDDEYGLKSARMLAELYNSGDLEDGINYNEALKWYLRAADVAEKIYGEEHHDTAKYYSNIAKVYVDLGNYDKAMEYYIKYLELCERFLGKEHSETATCYNNIGEVYKYKGNYKQALEYHIKALEIHEKTIGMWHQDTAANYNNLGVLYDKKGDFDKALEYHFKALEVYKKVFGKDDPNAARSYNNIGIVYGEKGDSEKALEYQFMALEIRENVLSKDHMDIANSNHNIGMIYCNKGCYDKALEYGFKGLVICEKVLGKEHPLTATCYHNIGGYYRFKGDTDKSLEYNIKALEIFEKVLGKGHPDTATSYVQIGIHYDAKGDRDKALEYYLKSVEIFEKVLGKENPNAATIFNQIGKIYYHKGEYETSLAYFFKNLKLKEKFLGKMHPDTATSYNDIGAVYYKQGDNVKALEYFKQALPIFIGVFGEQHPAVQTVKININNINKTISSQPPKTNETTSTHSSERVNKPVAERATVNTKQLSEVDSNKQKKPESWLKRLFKKSD
ncbi:MAG: tetratricopeptide repeat protein [Ruminococcus sp.]|jgi:tetratricopeptide (TPR) repeat protein|nr:tetratricopeptide repeat protein [Ruminococcus sp.]